MSRSTPPTRLMINDGPVSLTDAGHINPPDQGVVDGTSNTADNGTLPFRYENATHRLALVTGGNLQ
jgi:hypothetical protein